MNGKLLKPLMVAAVAVAVVAAGWQWFVCRFYVPPGFMAVLVAKEGKALPPGQLLAKNGQKGVQEEVLGEGRHFRNPIMFEWRIEPAVTIQPGKVGVVTAKVGADLPPGEFLADRGQKGIWQGVLGPGRYRLNPYGYRIDIVDAISVPIGYVGVVTALAGDKAPDGAFAGPHQKGIRGDILQPGLYFVNPKEFKIDVLEVGVNQVSMQGKEGGAVITKGQMIGQNRAVDDLQFKVLEQQAAQRKEYAKQEQSALSSVAEPRQSLLDKADRELAAPRARRPAEEGDGSGRGRRGPAMAAAAAPAAPPPPGKRLAEAAGDELVAANKALNIFSVDQVVGFPSRDGFDISLDMTVEFELPPDRIARVFRDYGDLPAVAEKIIIPQILSVSRLKGSVYRATDFIVGEGREQFQRDLTESLRKSLAERQIVVHNALIRHVNVPVQILEPIQQASIAKEENLTNREKQNTARKQAELNTEQTLIEQRGAEVAQETAKLKAEIKADKEKKVAEMQADALRQAAEIDRETARLKAERMKKLGRAEAEALRLVEGERAQGFQMKAQALGDPLAFNLTVFAEALNPAVKISIIHTGPGTLWTDLERATMGDLGGAKLIREKTPPAPAPAE